ncbi:Tetratricopeptide repeat (TPR)-like superfamily protein [Quillaja saponaria]|uniref:Tetratricopeptide repeat (TPR)-like superfamily protein n=1 Tax=Quillaja saponaria TaxID=32244 RepID=A0AAD7Q0F1_QUISA|nr:Tetratricopeptide repeat (TPR)-like superfamily protein [Quillaja saponaria]KAJ7972589.1 Tetratricopeptide repeat (TPR)-like superfamily protein [Quillaja saponaria]
MLLRSSSTPVLGSLLSSFSENPSNSIYCETNPTIKHPPTTVHQYHQRSPLHQTGCINLPSFSGNSSPISPSIADLERNKGFRRAQSDGNLQDLVYASCNNNGDHLCDAKLPKKFSGRPKCLMLETIPSFSFYNMKGEREEEEESDIEDEELGEELEESEGQLSGGEWGIAMGFDEFSLSNTINNSIVLTEEVVNKDEIWNICVAEEKDMVGKELYLARGLGIDGSGHGRGGGGGSGGGGKYNPAGSGGDGGDRQGIEEHYQRMVDENPGNPLFLRNYAEFLYQSKQDLRGADEYYSRAILADPRDGELLSQYAKLVWELHHDHDRASSYFERAVQASPEDCQVHAAYANFLWEIEDDEDNCDVPKDFGAFP